jgi:predicted O-methyltransferase YrrM
MNLEHWTVVDRYISDLFVPRDPVLENTLKASVAAGMPEINVAPNQGKFLWVLAKIQSAKRILEIGTLGGYSTIWLARALPKSGHLVTLELETKHAEVARKNFAEAGLTDIIELRVGPAIDSLRQLVAEKPEPFDFIFIDADKDRYPE